MRLEGKVAIVAGVLPGVVSVRQLLIGLLVRVRKSL